MTADRILPRKSFHSGVGATEAVTGLSFARHMHDTFGIGIICAGAQRSASGRGPVEAGPGDVITVNPGEVHDGAPIGERRAWRMLYFDPTLIHTAAAECGLASAASVEIRRAVLHDAALARRFAQAFTMVTNPMAEALAREAALVGLFEALLARHASSVRRNRPEAMGRIAWARQRIDDDPAADASLDALAAEAGLTRFQLLRAFQRETGLSPQAYRRVRRVQRARNLIRAGTRLAEAAVCVGFADQSHMNRAFLQVTGATPGAWARVQG